MAAPLDPVIAQILPLLPLRDAATMTAERARAELRALAAARADVPPPPVPIVEDAQAKGAAGPLNVRVYRLSREKAPTVAFFHGGGWVAGDIETHDRQARLLAIETGAVVVSVDYRRPPEAKFPAAFDDAVAAVRDIFARIGDFGGDASRIGVAGDSAGGNLAAVCAIACRDAGLGLAAQLLVYPATDLEDAYGDSQNSRYPCRLQNAEGYFLTHAMMKWFAGQYFTDIAQALDWRASPVKAASLAGVAPAVVCTAWYDPLRDEGDAYAEALQKAGVETKRHSGAGLVHGYFGMGEASEAARLEAQRARADFKAMLARGV